MFRFYYTKNRNQTINLPITSIQRTDGGWWFSEEYNGVRKAYQIIERKEISPSCFIELLSPLPEDFVELPCWKEYPQQFVVQELQGGQVRTGQEIQGQEQVREGQEIQGQVREGQGLQGQVREGQGLQGQGLQVQGLQGQGQGQGQMIEFCQCPVVPDWVAQEVGDHCSKLQEEVSKAWTLLEKGALCLLQSPIQGQKRKVEHPSQSFVPSQDYPKPSFSESRKDAQQFRSQPLQQPFQKHQEPMTFSGPPRCLQTGSLCPPTFVQEPSGSQGSHSRPLKIQKLAAQGRQKHPQECLIVLE